MPLAGGAGHTFHQLRDTTRCHRGSRSSLHFSEAFEVALVVTFVVTWSEPEIRSWLLVGLASHAAMRIWSAFDFIPKPLAFERADPVTVAESTARSWTRRSVWRLPLDVVTCVAMLAAFAGAAQLA
jgi:hypothetical protein